MTHFPPLVSGDTIAIIATARFVTREDIQPFVTDIESWGYKVILGPHLFEVNDQFAGTDIQKAEALQWAIDHPEVKAIFCVRGGYGTIRMIDKVNLHALKTNAKPIFGFSDITVLHSALNLLGVSSVHSTMPLSWKDNTDEAKLSVKQVLSGNIPTLQFEPHSLNRAGEVVGELIGGNLSILYSLSGTPYFPDFTGKILFIEDLDEYLYHVDRMMQNLKHACVFAKIAGLVIGGMSDMNDNAVPFGKTAEEIIAETVSDYDFPVYFNLPAGHIKDNQTMVFGARYKLSQDGLEPLRREAL